MAQALRRRCAGHAGRAAGALHALHESGPFVLAAPTERPGAHLLMRRGAALQFAFLAFLLGQSLEAFGQWKALLHLLLACEEAPLRTRTPSMCAPCHRQRPAAALPLPRQVQGLTPFGSLHAT